MPELEKQVAFGDIAEDFQRAVRHTERKKRAVVASAYMAHGVYNSRRYGFSLAVRGAAAAEKSRMAQAENRLVWQLVPAGLASDEVGHIARKREHTKLADGF